MSNTIGSPTNWWYCQNQGTQAPPGSSATGSVTASSGSVSNIGTAAAASTLSTFCQTFSADLQAMLNQAGSGTAATATPQTGTDGTPASAAPANQTAQTQTAGHVPHHHHHHGGEADSMQTAANQLVGAVSQLQQTGSLTSAGISSAASTFATDITQALQSYGTTTPGTLGLSVVA